MWKKVEGGRPGRRDHGGSEFLKGLNQGHQEQEAGERAPGSVRGRRSLVGWKRNEWGIKDRRPGGVKGEIGGRNSKEENWRKRENGKGSLGARQRPTSEPEGDMVAEPTRARVVRTNIKTST